MPRGLGFTCKTVQGLRKDGFLFGEAQGRVVLSVRPADVDEILAIGQDSGVPVHELGTVTDGGLEIDGHDYGHVSGWAEDYRGVIGAQMAD
jgi:phosphoribosylformylglycinamidine synthase